VKRPAAKATLARSAPLRGRRLGAVVALGFMGVAGCGRESGGGSERSVILITVDTLRADRIGVYGHAAARTPALDALARRGALFLAATTPFPRTTPALASLLTGRLPWRHGSREVGQPMTADLATLASILAARGYTTLGVSVNGAAGPAQNLHLGFGRFLDYRSFADHTATGVTDATVALLDEAARRPLLLWVHYIDPHFPYAPPATWRDQPEATACRDLVAKSGDDLVATAHVRIDLDGVASAALDDCAALYDAEIAYTDSEIGRLLGALESRGLLRDAYVVFTSDHGENLGEDHLFYEHGPSVHDASLRVPLLIAGPGIEPRRDRGVARLEDLPPTLLALLGVPPADWPPFDGADLSPRLLGSRASAAAEPPSAIAESGGALLPETFTYLRSGRPGDRQCTNGSRFSLCVDPGAEPRLYDHLADPLLERDVSARFPAVKAALETVARRWPLGEARERTLRTTRYKLVERPRPEGGWSAALYDLEADPGETRDLAAGDPELAARLRRELDAAFRDVEAAAPPELEPRELEALRALGYVR
jgi:arylsulfatase